MRLWRVWQVGYPQGYIHLAAHSFGIHFSRAKSVSLLSESPSITYSSSLLTVSLIRTPSTVSTARKCQSVWVLLSRLQRAPAFPVSAVSPCLQPSCLVHLSPLSFPTPRPAPSPLVLNSALILACCPLPSVYRPPPTTALFPSPPLLLRPSRIFSQPSSSIPAPHSLPSDGRRSRPPCSCSRTRSCRAVFAPWCKGEPRTGAVRTRRGPAPRRCTLRREQQAGEVRVCTLPLSTAVLVY
jgi:hypothetical protein